MAMLTILSFNWWLWISFLTADSTSAAICQTSTPGLFVSHPLDQTVKEGDNVTFTCIARNVRLEHVELLWEVYPDVYDRSTITNLAREKLLITSRTTVFRIGQTGQTFRCLLKYSVGYPEVCYYSHVARTNVQFFPKHTQLSCGPDISDGLHEGETIVLKCAAPRGNPPVDLRWTYDTYPETDIALPVIRDGLQRSITINLDINRDMHLLTPICQVTSEVIFPGLNETCSLGPIMVFQKPHVIIYPVQATTELTSITPIRFQCIAQGFPTDFAFSWSCNPENNMCDLERSKDTLHVTAALRTYTVTKFESMSISCTVSNSFGVSKNVSKVILLQPRHNYEVCAESEPNDNQPLRLDLKQETAEYPIPLTCSLHAQVRSIDVNFTWYLNGKFILSVTKRSEDAMYPLFSVTLNNISTSDVENVIFCKVSGTVGVHYVTISTCIGGNRNENAARTKEVRESAIHGNLRLMATPPLYDSDLDLEYEAKSNMNDSSAGVRATSSSHGTNLSLQEFEVTTGNDMERDTVKTTAVDNTLVRNETFSILHGNAVVLATAVILLVAVIALFLLKWGLNNRRTNAFALETIGVPEERDECSWVEPFYEVPNVPSTSNMSNEEITLRCSNSSRSASSCSVYTEGYDGRGSCSSSPYSSSTCSCDYNEILEL